MSLRSAFWFSCLLLVWAGGTLEGCGQDVVDTEIEFLEIQAYDNGFSSGIKFTLTANQFVERLYMENSYDLKTWLSNEIFPNFEFEADSEASFFSYPFGPMFYQQGLERKFPSLEHLFSTVSPSLRFITDRSGNYEYFEVVNNFEQSKGSGTFDLNAFPLIGAEAPPEAAFARMAIGQHIINSA